MNRYSKTKHAILGGLIALTALLTVDLWSVNQRFLNEDNYTDVRPGQNYGPELADERILQDEELGYRVLNLNGTFSDNHTPYFHRAVGGYHPVKLRKTQDLIDFYMNREIQYVIQQLQNAQSLQNLGAIFENTPVLNMLNTKYVVYNLEQPPILNPYAYGAAWFVESKQIVDSPDQEIIQLGNVDIKSTAIQRMDESSRTEGDDLNFDTEESSVQLTTYSPHKLTYTTDAANDGFVVFSEVYYKDWKVTLKDMDGNVVATPTLDRVNWIMRGVEIPKGQHVVEFEFYPDEIVKAWKISTASSLVIIVLIVGMFMMVFFRWIGLVKINN